MGYDAFVVGTGGLSSLIASHTDIIDVVDKKLSLQGLNDICLIFRSGQ